MPGGFQLNSGTGCEHIVVGRGLDYKPLAITSRTEHRGFRKSPEDKLGFAFIGLASGKPILLGTQSPECFPPLKDIRVQPHTWQGLDWNPDCKFAGKHGLIAAAPTMSRFNDGTSKPFSIVEFFTLENREGRVGLKRYERESTPLLSSGARTNINAITLASNGDVYVSVIDINPLKGGTPVAVNEPVCPSSTILEKNAVYLYKYEVNKWIRVARSIPAANGLYLAEDGKTLCVSSFSKGRVAYFSREPSTGLLSNYRSHSLGYLNSPDNLSPIDGTRASAMTTPGLLSGIALGLGALLSSDFGLHPSATIFEVDSRNHLAPRRPLGTVPWGQGAFSAATRFGDWWLCGKMIGEGIYCMPTTSTP